MATEGSAGADMRRRLNFKVSMSFSPNRTALTAASCNTAQHHKMRQKLQIRVSRNVCGSREQLGKRREGPQLDLGMTGVQLRAICSTGSRLLGGDAAGGVGCQR